MTTNRNDPPSARAVNAPLRTADERLSSLFPDLSGDTQQRWWNRRWRLGVAVALVLALVAGGLVIAQTSGADAVSYRTARAELREVDAVFTSVATIEPVAQSAVGFPVTGTVATVDVAVGDTVTIGQELATLDTDSLEDAVRSAQANFDQANLVLSKALDGEDVSALSGGGGGGAAGSFQPASTTTSSTSTNAVLLSTGASSSVELVAATQDPNAQLAAAQQAVLDAQKRVDATMLTAQQALTASNDVCASAAAPTTTVTSTTEPTATDPDGTDPELTACQTALRAVQDAQLAVNDAQTALAAASTSLDELLTELSANTAAPSGQDGGRSGSGAAPSDGSGAPTGGSGASGAQPATNSPSAEDLVAYQKAVDAAELQLAVANQALAQATIVSPIEGTVVAVNFTAGESVASGSSTNNVIIQGTGGFEVTTTVGVDDLSDLEVGQDATVLPDGASDPIDGQVVSIALTGDPADATYQVVVGLEGDTSSLRNGSTGTLTIITGQAESALAVPTSAITTDGDTHSVTVVDGANVTVTTVRVGVIGATWTEILSGIEESTEVALANLDEPLPGSATETTDATTDAEGFPGAGGRPGGGAGGFRAGGGGGRFPGGGIPGGN